MQFRSSAAWQFTKHFQLICSIQIPTIDLETALNFADWFPCFSLAALTTFMVKQDMFPIPFDPSRQKQLLTHVSDQVVVDWKECMETEMKVARKECVQSDIDFNFVVDSSASVGLNNWKLMMNLIGTHWIKKVLIPNGSKTCGNHVAGRWFSSETERFHDYEPPSEDIYAPQTYADYVADVFMNTSYNLGLTDTARAIKMVRNEDIPTARNGLKYVLFLTDGTSIDKEQTKAEAEKLHEVTDRAYSFGVGDDVDSDELHDIASSPMFVGHISFFSDLENFVRNFVLVQKGCFTINKQPYRVLELEENTSYG